MAKKIEWVILRGERAANEDDTEPTAAPRTEAAGGAIRRPRVEIDTMDAERRKRAHQDKTVLASAPRMPISLIRAQPASRAGRRRTGDIAWGVEAVSATRSPFDGTGVTVAVLDTGIQATHAAFAGVTLSQRNFTTEAPEDLDGHGTHCAGTIFGQDLENFRIGIARKVDRALIGKVLGEGGGSSENIVNAILWAKSEGAHVISMSLGMDFAGFRTELVNKGFKDAEATSIALAGYQQNTRLFDKLSQSLVAVDAEIFGGTVLVAAAGNESKRPDYSIIVAPPASGERFLSVAALKQVGGEKKYDVAKFSNEGAVVSAPGEDIMSAELNRKLVALSGTSMAAPHVAGVAALWAQKRMVDEDFSADWVWRRIRETVVPFPHLDRQDVGDGLVQAPVAA